MIQTTEKQISRIISIDVIRGVAILGILLMNIQSFSMVGQAYMNPTAFGDLSGLNLFTWVFCHIMADQKFMTIFSLLFGASALMIANSAERNNQSSFKVHYRRNFLLLLMGLLHAYLIWYGDILAPYAMCAFLIFPFRNYSIKTLLVIGIILFSITSLIDLLYGYHMVNLPDKALKQIQGGWNPSLKQIAKEIDAYRGDYISQFGQRASTAFLLQTNYFFTHYFWRISGLMFIGMALFKSGFLSGKLSSRVYKKIIYWLGIPGFLLVTMGVYFNFESNWSIEFSLFYGSQFNYWGSLGMALSYISAIILFCEQKLFNSIVNRLAAIGKMALSNYLLQSIICTSLFYGLEWFGKTERVYQVLIVIPIWAFQIYISNFWLQYFPYGPFEWCWRKLTYWGNKANKK